MLAKEYRTLTSTGRRPLITTKVEFDRHGVNLYITLPCAKLYTKRTAAAKYSVDLLLHENVTRRILRSRCFYSFRLPLTEDTIVDS
jgi:hypothetical protein